MEKDAADVLYNTATPQATATPSDASVHPEAKVAAKVYPVKTDRLSNAARVAYTNREDDLRFKAGLTRDEAEQKAADAYAAGEEAGIGPFDRNELIHRLFNADVDQVVADARGTGAEPDEATEQVRREEARRAVAVAFPQDDVDELLARTNRFVKAHPRLRATLDRSGLGNDRDTVVSLVEHVRAVNFR
jgi:hypothetical protein